MSVCEVDAVHVSWYPILLPGHVMITDGDVVQKVTMLKKALPAVLRRQAPCRWHGCMAGTGFPTGV